MKTDKTEGKNSRDVKPELLRTLACFMVILIHIRIQPIQDGTILKTPVLIGCLLTPSVGLFFLVTGFFMFGEQKTWWKTAKNFLVRILAPTLVTVVLTLLFSGWIMGQGSIADCLKTADFAWIFNSLKNGILYMSVDYWGVLCAHFWYIAEYAKLILFFPAIAVLARYAGKKILLFLAGLNLYFCLMIDFVRFFGQFPFFHVESFLRVSQAIVLFGFLLYQSREKLKSGKKISVALFAAYAASVLWMFIAQMKQFQIEGGDWSNAYYTTWLSGIGIASAILLAAFVLSLPDHLKVLEWMKKPILFLGGLSFSIYLVQYAIIVKMSTRGIASRFAVLARTPGGTVLYYLIYGLFIFFLSAAVAWCLRFGVSLLSRGARKLTNLKTVR